MSTATNNAKKRKSGSNDTTSPRSKKPKTETSPAAVTATDSSSNADNDFTMFTLEDIRTKLQSLCERVPPIPEGSFILKKDESDGKTTSSNNGNSDIAINPEDIDESAARQWAAQLQAVLEKFNLYACCVATATYKWGTDRSGAADQNLGLLNGEIIASQEQISSTVTPRLTNILAPVVDLVIEKTITTKDANGVEIKENHFTRKLVDKDFFTLSHVILARNAFLLRHVVLSNFHKLLQALNDYLKAQKNDTQHSRGFTY